MVREKLYLLEEIFRKTNAPILQYFNPGLAKSVIDEKFLEIVATASFGLSELYEWHNGISFSKKQGTRQGLVELLPMGTMFELEEASSIRSEMISDGLMDDDPGNYWPIFGSGEDDTHLLHLYTGEIYFYSPMSIIYGKLEFKSLERMFDFVLECHEDKIFWIDPVKGQEINSDKYFQKLDNEVRE